MADEKVMGGVTIRDLSRRKFMKVAGLSAAGLVLCTSEAPAPINITSPPGSPAYVDPDFLAEGTCDADMFVFGLILVPDAEAHPGDNYSFGPDWWIWFFDVPLAGDTLHIEDAENPLVFRQKAIVVECGSSQGLAASAESAKCLPGSAQQRPLRVVSVGDMGADRNPIAGSQHDRPFRIVSPREDWSVDGSFRVQVEVADPAVRLWSCVASKTMRKPVVGRSHKSQGLWSFTFAGVPPGEGHILRVRDKKNPAFVDWIRINVKGPGA